MMTSNLKHIVEATNAFTIDLYNVLREFGGNLFISPWNIATAFAQVYAGAKGNTETQIAKVLRFKLTQRQTHDAFGAIIENLQASEREGSHQLSVANALWLKHGLQLKPEFQAVLKNSYKTTVDIVDFRHAEEAANTINAWASKQTRGKIPEIIHSDMISVLTRLVLASAIYFKGFWVQPFEKDRTQEAPFTLLNGESVQVPLMHQVKRFNYMETQLVQALELPYLGDRLSMVVLLPQADDGLPELERKLSPMNLTAWLGQMVKQKVNIFLPRFTVTSEFELNEHLETLGMTDAFSTATANFSGITPTEDLYISLAIHKAFIEVDEEGTTAAAVTAVVMAPKGLPAPIPIFRCDHPFLFLIRDTRTGTILFIGRVINPAK
ncbi:MAG: serpin family protein [Promethearchaeota archaeon]